MNSGFGFWLRMDGLDQRDGALLMCGAGGEQLKGWRIRAGVGRAAGLAHDSGQSRYQAGEAVHRLIVVQPLGLGLALRRGRTLGGCHRFRVALAAWSVCTAAKN